LLLLIFYGLTIVLGIQKMVRITALMENKPSEQKALINEHGLSLLIECEGKRYLFDTGSGPHFMDNAEHLGISLDGLDAVILSHAHYDHAGGFRYLVKAGHKVPALYHGEGFFNKKYAYDGVKLTDLSAGFDKAFLNEHGIKDIAVGQMLDSTPSLHIVSGFERRNKMETIPERFVICTEDGLKRDDFSDEVACVIETGKGLVVLCGCSHPGILNISESIHDRFRKPIYAILGGTHLVEADTERIGKTVEKLKEMGLTVFGLCHCSGEEAEEMIKCDRSISSCHLSSGDVFQV